jgi:hypothetical protein
MSISLVDLSSLKNFPYQPWTNFSGFFSPHITFGANTEDRPVETKVLDTVGSYGSQINRIMDAPLVLTSQLEPNTLSPDENFKILKFRELAFRADQVTADFRHRRRNVEVTEAKVKRLLDAIEDLKNSHNGAYQHLTGVIKDWLPPATES